MKDMISQYNLDHSQLAFTVCRKVRENDQLNTYMFPATTVFSEEMIEGGEKNLDGDTEVRSPNEKPLSSPPLCRVYKYAPKYGYDRREEEMVIFLTSKPEPRKYGGLMKEKFLSLVSFSSIELQVNFQSTIFGTLWSVPVAELDLKDRMLAFKTPKCPNQLKEILPVDVIIRQGNRTIDTVKYFYIPKSNSNSKNSRFIRRKCRFLFVLR